MNNNSKTPSTLTIPAGNLQPRNIESVVKLTVGGGIMVGVLESYSVMPDGKTMDLKLRGCEAVSVPSRMELELSRSSDYNARVAQSMSVQELLHSVLANTTKALAVAKETDAAIHDIADLLDTDVPDSPAGLSAVTPLVMAAA